MWHHVARYQWADGVWHGRWHRGWHDVCGRGLHAPTLHAAGVGKLTQHLAGTMQALPEIHWHLGPEVGRHAIEMLVERPFKQRLPLYMPACMPHPRLHDHLKLDEEPDEAATQQWQPPLLAWQGRHSVGEGLINGVGLDQSVVDDSLVMARVLLHHLLTSP